MDTGVMSGAPSPNNYEVRCNALEEGKASPASPVAGIAMTVESDSGMIRRWLLGSYLVVAAAILTTCYYFHLFAATSDLGTPSPLHCRSTFFRYNTAIGGSSCGLWGEECLPSTWMPIRCPALCGYSLHDALDTRVIGSSTYRADSRICLAAWHAGFIGAGGGCVDVRVAEGKEEYVKEQRNGIDGLAFDSWFPFSLEFRASSGAKNCGYDQTPTLLVLNVLLLVGFLSLRPSRRLFFWSMITSMWWYCALIAPMDNRSISTSFAYMGRFAYFVVGAEVLLWRFGHAKCTFPDTSNSSSFLHVILIELLPLIATLHWHFLSIFGSYSINGALFQSWEGPMTFLAGLVLLLPLAIGVLRDWYRAKLLFFLLRHVFFVAVLIIVLTLIFSTSGWGLHLHHYFIALFCYVASRGSSKCSALARALCLGALINGLAFWGETYEIPIWAEGEGWYPPSGDVDMAAFGNYNQVLFTAAERVNESDNILLRWAFVKDLSASNCSLDNVDVQDGSIFVVEMNHIEIYRGPARSLRFQPNATRFGVAKNATHLGVAKNATDEERHVYVRVAQIGQGLSRRVISATQVLALRYESSQPLTWPYALSLDDCTKATAIAQQPDWTLEGYV